MLADIALKRAAHSFLGRESQLTANHARDRHNQVQWSGQVTDEESLNREL